MFLSRIHQEMNSKRKKHLSNFPYQLKPPIKRFKRAEAQEVISNINPKKSSGYNLVTDNILKELPIIRIKYLTQLFNAVLLKGYFPGAMKSSTGHPHLEARKTFY
jgi:hypothetical protein